MSHLGFPGICGTVSLLFGPLLTAAALSCRVCLRKREAQALATPMEGRCLCLAALPGAWASPTHQRLHRGSAVGRALSRVHSRNTPHSEDRGVFLPLDVFLGAILASLILAGLVILYRGDGTGRAGL